MKSAYLVLLSSSLPTSYFMTSKGNLEVYKEPTLYKKPFSSMAIGLSTGAYQTQFKISPKAVP